MAAGLPVVAARAGALPELVADAAELVDPNSPAEMAAGLERVLGDRERHADLAARGLRRAAEFSWDRAAALAVAEFRKLSDQLC
jgi:glycosyltransferase involved in cell wall biosynthesis